eukprot:2241762-Amphidinium_carterae.1
MTGTSSRHVLSSSVHPQSAGSHIYWNVKLSILVNHYTMTQMPSWKVVCWFGADEIPPSSL